jgi:hypothetical protein
MNEADVRTALDRATRHLQPQPDLLERVHAGARRRIVRRHVAVTAAVVAVIAATAVNALAGARGLDGYPASEPSVSASAPNPDSWAQYKDWKGPYPLLEGATRGDLAHDTAFLREATALWKTRDSRMTLTGEPHVVWAGNTPAGKAAFIAQRGDEPGIPIIYGHLGMVEPGPDGRPIIEDFALMQHPETTDRPITMLIGAKRDVLVILDTGLKITYSPDFAYAPDGTIARTFRPVTFTDGAAVIRVPAQNERYTLAMGNPGVDVNYPIEPDNDGAGSLSGLYSSGPGNTREGWALPERRRTTENCVLTGEDRFRDLGALHPVAASTEWHIEARTPDGHYVCLNTRQFGNDVRHVIYGIGTSDSPPPVARFGGSSAPSAPLAVRLRLPGKQGVIVAAEQATLRYRSGDGPWIAVQGYVALLPDAATAVQVIRKGKPTATVDLP